MKIFAISDLHLCLSGEKPMDIFGETWEKIAYERYKGDTATPQIVMRAPSPKNTGV